ncbi:MAG: metal ABC transporter permease [Planctomycetes bacterium]|nr:metal ABC transporter permease [Planctomycetota bacterium]
MSAPISYWQAVAETPLLLRGACAGALVGLACACLSPFVVLRRLAFVGDGMAHAAFGGLGLGLFLIAGSRADDPLVQLIMLGFCLVLAVAVGRATRQRESGREEGKLAADSAIGIAFAVSMALGALLITLRQRREPQYKAGWEGYLFGSLLTIGESQVWITFALAGAVLLALVLFHKELTFYTYDETLAELSGLPVGFLHYLFLALLVLTVVVSARIVGIVLVSSSLVLPGVAGLALAQRLPVAVCIAGAIGVLSYQVGLYASFTWNIPPGAAVVLVQFACVVAAQAVRVARGATN